MKDFRPSRYHFRMALTIGMLFRAFQSALKLSRQAIPRELRMMKIVF